VLLLVLEGDQQRRLHRRVAERPGVLVDEDEGGDHRRPLRARRATPEVAPDGCFIEAPWLVDGRHGASLKQPLKRPAAPPTSGPAPAPMGPPRHGHVTHPDVVREPAQRHALLMIDD
jgi:hypothetical protein